MTPKDTQTRLASRVRALPRVLRLALVLGVFLLGRELLIRGALGRASSEARRLAEASRLVLPDATPSQGLRREAFWWLLEPAGDPRPPADPQPEGPGLGRGPGSLRRLGPVPAPVVSLPSAVVLGLAERGAVPRGATRAAQGDLPAGIEILDGAGLGIGWFPGDRLILVDGVPVTDRAEVVRHVLEGRAHHAPVVTATLARRTQGGVVTYQVLVEQPYPALDEPTEVQVPPAP